MHGKDFRINLLLDYYGETLTERQREVMDLYYNEDMSLFEISEHVGVTRQGVHDLIKRSENALVELDGKLGFVDRFSEIDHHMVGFTVAPDVCRIHRVAGEVCGVPDFKHVHSGRAASQ